MSIRDYQRQREVVQRSLLQHMAGGRARVEDLAVLRRTVILMDHELRRNPQSVLAYDHLQERGMSGPHLWHFIMYELAHRQVLPRLHDPQAIDRKLAEYITFGQSVLASRTLWRRHITDRRNGIAYIIKENSEVIQVVRSLIRELQLWSVRHITDEDFQRLSPQEGLIRLLRERMEFVAAFRVAQMLPVDVDRIAIPIDKPAHVETIELLIGIIPVVGSAVALYEAYTGRDLFGYRLNPVERSILAGAAIIPVVGRFIGRGGRALYTAARMERLYGSDARTWTRVLGSGERLSGDAAGLRIIRESEANLRAGRRLTNTAAQQVDAALSRNRFASPSVALRPTTVAQPVREAFERLSRDHRAIADLDELALQRILDKGPNVDHMKGQLLEEVLETRIVQWLRNPAGRTALGLDESRGALEFIPGHRIRDTAGRQITDGIVARRADDVLEIVAIFEAKAGRRAARELWLSSSSRSRLSRAEQAELHAYARDIHRELLEQARLAGTTVDQSIDDIERQIVLSERGGQVGRDIERLGQDVSGTLARLVVGSVETQVRVTPKTTKVFGVLPRDLRPGHMERDLRDLGYNFEVLGIDLGQAELRQIASELSSLVP